MHRTRLTVAVTGLAVAATTIALAAPATAAPVPKSPLFSASASGLAANLVGGLVNTGPYAPVAITTRSTSKQASADAATASLPGLLNTDGVSSTVSTQRNAKDTATIVNARSHTAKVNVPGILTLGAIDTVSTLTVRPVNVTGTAKTTFTNLRIAGQSVINGQVDPNTTIELPGIARIVLNASGVAGGNREGMAVSTGIIITLLGGTGIGSTIAVNATTAQTQFVSPFYAPLNGFGFSAQVSAGADASLNIGPLGAIGMPSTGTKGQPLVGTLGTSPLGGLGSLGAGTTTAVGTVSNGGSRSTITNRIENLSLLGGLVSADAVTSTADVLLDRTGTTTRKATSNFVNLRVAGIVIPLDVAVNTTIALPGVGGVVLRGTATTPTAAAAAAVTITLTTAAFGLPVGATITVGFAYASVVPNDL